MTRKVDDNQEHNLEEALEQYIDSKLRGQEPDLAELVKRYPEQEHLIIAKLGKLQKINNLFDSLAQTDESEFENAVVEHDLVGQKIGNFKIAEMIGRGGMGVVYLARDTKLKRSVVIKSIPAALSADSTARTRFRREAELLASLNHSNIAVIYDIIELDAGADYLILEYVPGETLAERITKEPLKLQETLTIALQISEAMMAAHEHDVIHRDLKPSNIKITPDGRVKVLDFGLAKALGGESLEKSTTVTQPGRVMGTPAYMSPEQACGKSTDHRTDIWSFGCVLYEMLTGHLPFEGETATEILARIIEREPDWQILPQETPTNIRTLLRRCLEKDPQRRLRDIGDAAIEISETLNRPVSAPPVTTPSSMLLKTQITARHKLRIAAMIVVAAFVIVLSVIAVQLVSRKEVQPSLKEIRLVVLPFENLGSTEDEYFADGITDEMITHLAGIHRLRVIPRYSAMQLKNTDKNMQQIAKELAVDYVLDGTIQREQASNPNRPSDPNSPVRIRIQFIRTADNTLVWGQAYDKDMKDILHLQSDLAEQVTKALDITLLEPERQALASRPTENIEAYEYYLRGNEYFRIGSRTELENDLRIAIRMYQNAVKRDPAFALAYAQLSRAHVYMYWWYHDRSEERLALAKQAVDKAFQMNPNLPEVHLALGHYYYHGHLDYDHAFEQLTIARKRQPNSSEIIFFIAAVQRRQGKFEQAVVNLKKAFELDPLYSKLARDIGGTFRILRKYPEAERYYNRAISLSPDWPLPYEGKAWLYVLAQGRTEKARAVLNQASQNIGAKDEDLILFRSVLLEVFDGNYKKALDRLSLGSSETFERQFYFIPKALLSGQINGLMGDQQAEQVYYESARNILESKIKEQPEDARFHSSLGIAYAGLGRKQDAIRAGQLAVDLLPVTKEAWKGTFRIEALAKIYVMVGEFDAAIERLEFLLSVPGEVSIPLLRLDPTWDNLRNHSRFKKLINLDK